MDYTYSTKRAVGISRKEDLRIYDMPGSKNNICLRSVQNTCVTLVVLELQRCSLSSMDFILGCQNLRYCSLSDNLITVVPSLRNFVCLQYLILSNNKIETTQHIANLKTCTSLLLYLNLKGNPVHFIGNYRAYVLRLLLKSSCRLKCLDNFIIGDYEWIAMLDSGGKKLPKLVVRPSHFVPELLIELPASLDTVKNFERTLYHLNFRVKLLDNICNALSSVRFLQNMLRYMLRNKNIFKLLKVLPVLQAHARRRLYRAHLERELFSILKDYNCVNLYPATSLSYDSRRHRAISTIKKFIRKMILVTRKRLAAKKLVRCVRKFILHRRIFIERLIGQKVSGLVFPTHMQSCVLECIQRIRNSAKEVGKTTSKVLRFSEESQILKSTEVKTPSIMSDDQLFERIHFLKLFHFGEPQRGHAEILWDSFTHSRNTAKKGRHSLSLSTLKYKASAHREDEAQKTPTKQKSTKMLMLSQKIQNLKEMKSSRKLDVSEDEEGVGSSSSPGPRIAPKSRRFILRNTDTFLGAVGKYCNSVERKLLVSLKARGNKLLPDERRDISHLLEADKDCPSFRNTSDDLVLLRVTDPLLISRIYTLVISHRLAASHSIYFDSMVCDRVAAISIQRYFRGIIRRKRHLKETLIALVRRRACVAIQRCWRLSAGLWRRFKLLNSISMLCKEINSSTLYIDVWLFYSLLRLQRLAALPCSLTLFPEFRGIPLVSSDGHCMFGNLEADSVHFKRQSLEESNRIMCTPTTHEDRLQDFSQEFHHSYLFNDDLQDSYNEFLCVRYGIPLWLPWRPRSNNRLATDSTTTSPIFVESRSEAEWPLFNLLVKNVDLGVENIPLLLSAEQKSKLHRKYTSKIIGQPIRVIRLQFASIAEAKCRAAMIMLCTYDSVSRTSVKLMSTSSLLDRVRENSSNIVKQLTTYFECLESLEMATLVNFDLHSSQPSSKRALETSKQQPFLHNIWELRIKLAEAPRYFDVKDTFLSEIIRVRLLLDYLQILPIRLELPDLHQVYSSDTIINLESVGSSRFDAGGSIAENTSFAENSIHGSISSRQLYNSIEDRRSIISESTSQFSNLNSIDYQNQQLYNNNGVIQRGSYLEDTLVVKEVGHINETSHRSKRNDDREDTEIAFGPESKISATELLEYSLPDLNREEASEHIGSVATLSMHITAKSLQPSEWVDEKIMFSKLNSLIMEANNSPDLILGPIADYYLMNLWTRDRLLMWCSRNRERSAVDNVGSETALNEDGGTSSVKTYKNWIESRDHRRDLSGPELADKQELLRRGKRHMALVAQSSRSNSAGNDGVLRECLIPCQPKQSLRRSAKFTRIKSRSQPVPSSQLIKSISHSADGNTATSVNFQSFMNNNGMNSTEVRSINDNEQVVCPKSTTRIVLDLNYNGNQSDSKHITAAIAPILPARVQIARENAQRDRKILLKKSSEFEEQKNCVVQEVKTRTQANKLEHERLRLTRDQSIKLAGSLASLASKVDASYRGQLKANRMKFLFERVQRIRTAGTLNDSNEANISNAELNEEKQSDRKSTGRTLQLSARQSTDLGADDMLLIQTLSPASQRPMSKSTRSRSAGIRLLGVNGGVDGVPQYSAQDMGGDTFVQLPANSTGLIASTLPLANVDTTARPIGIASEGIRRQSILTMDSLNRRQSILTLNTIEIPSLDPRPNYATIERFDSAYESSSIGHDLGQTEESMLSMEPSASIAMSIGPPILTSTPLLTPTRPTKSLEKYFRWGRSVSQGDSEI